MVSAQWGSKARLHSAILASESRSLWLHKADLSPPVVTYRDHKIQSVKLLTINMPVSTGGATIPYSSRGLKRHINDRLGLKH